MYMHIKLDYTFNLAQRLEWAKNINWDEANYKPKEIELIADYILYADKPTPKKTSKYVKPKTISRGTNPIESHTAPVAEYTNPRPIMHKDDPIIQQYQQSIEDLKLAEEKVPEDEKWKVRRWRLEHSLDMGLANTLLYPTMRSIPTYSKLVPPNIDELVDLTNSFHIAKLIDLYSQLRQSEDSKLWIQWIEYGIIDKTPLYDWQMHLLIRRIDGTNQITIGRELGELYGKIVTPSTISQALRTIYRQISITAEKELYAFFNKDNPKAWRTCRRCGEKKLIEYDFYPSKPHICKVCVTGKTTIKGNMKYSTTKKME